MLEQFGSKRKGIWSAGLWFPKNPVKLLAPQDNQNQVAKIREDYLSGYSHRVSKRLELQADKLDLQPHPTKLYGLGINNLIDMFGSPIDLLEKLKLRRTIIRRTSQKLGC